MEAGRDHNATSYSTETDASAAERLKNGVAEIITLRAIALKLHECIMLNFSDD